MNFKLKNKKGESRKVRKEWLDKPYRIVWRCEVRGVKVPPGFQACVFIDEQWDFTDRRGTYKTFAAAEKSCAKHQKEYVKVLEAPIVRKRRGKSQ